MMQFTDPGSAEPTKAAVHGALLVLTLMCGTYNVCAWLARHERHSVVNCAVYLGLSAWEVYQIGRHCRHEPGCVLSPGDSA